MVNFVGVISLRKEFLSFRATMIWCLGVWNLLQINLEWSKDQWMKEDWPQITNC